MKQITLTRTTNQSIAVSPGTIVVWQAITRNNGFTTAGGGVVNIPDSGYYTFSLNYNSSALHTARAILIINGVSVLDMAVSTFSNARQGATITRYFTAGNTVQVTLIPSVAITMTVVSAGLISESPILHVVQLSGAVD